MVRPIFGVVLAAVLMFFWGFIFWTLTPFPFFMISKLPNESSVVSVLKNEQLSAGHYFVPGHDEAAHKADAKKAEEDWTARMHQGPRFTLIYQPDGGEVMSPKVLGMGFVHMLVSASLVAVLLCLAGPGLLTYGARWLFVILVGVFASVNIHLGNPIWFHHTWTSAGVLTFFDTVGWILAAFPLAAFVKRTA